MLPAKKGTQYNVKGQEKGPQRVEAKYNFIKIEQVSKLRRIERWTKSRLTENYQTLLKKEFCVKKTKH